MSWIDVMILGIFLFSVITGYSRGLILTLSSLVSFFISIFFANRFYKDLASYITVNTGIKEEIKSLLLMNSEKSGVIEASSYLTGSKVNNLPRGAQDYIQGLLMNGATVEIGNMVSNAVIYILSFLALFLFIRFGFYLLSQGLNTLTKLPVLHQINKVSGGFMGIVQGIISNMVLISILYTIALFGLNQDLVKAIDNSIIAQYFYIGYLFY